MTVTTAFWTWVSTHLALSAHVLRLAPKTSPELAPSNCLKPPVLHQHCSEKPPRVPTLPMRIGKELVRLNVTSSSVIIYFYHFSNVIIETTLTMLYFISHSVNITIIAIFQSFWNCCFQVPKRIGNNLFGHQSTLSDETPFYPTGCPEVL